MTPDQRRVDESSQNKSKDRKRTRDFLDSKRKPFGLMSQVHTQAAWSLTDCIVLHRLQPIVTLSSRAIFNALDAMFGKCSEHPGLGSVSKCPHHMALGICSVHKVLKFKLNMNIVNFFVILKTQEKLIKLKTPGKIFYKCTILYL